MTLNSCTIIFHKFKRRSRDSMEKFIPQYLWRVFANGAGRGADDLVSTGTRQYAGQTDNMVWDKRQTFVALHGKKNHSPNNAKAYPG